MLLVQLHGAAIELKSLFEILHPDFAAAQPDSRFDMAGAHSQDILVLLTGGAIVQVIEQHRCQIEARRQVLRIGLDCLMEVDHCPRSITQLEVSQAQVVEGLSRKLVQRQDLVLENPLRDLQVLSEHVDEPPSIECNHIARLNGEHVLDEVLSSSDEVKLLRLVSFPLRLHQPVEGQSIVGFDIIWRLDNYLVKEVLGLPLQVYGRSFVRLLPRLPSLGQIDFTNIRSG